MILALAAALAVPAAPAAGQSPPLRYRFDPVGESVPRGVGVVIQVRITDLRGQPRTGVTFTEPRIDHAPDGAASASFPAFPLPQPGEAGVYAFRTTIPVSGYWALRLQAKAPGDPQPVFASVTFKVVEPPRRTAAPVLARDPAVKRVEPLSSARPQKRNTIPSSLRQQGWIARSKANGPLGRAPAQACGKPNAVRGLPDMLNAAFTMRWVNPA